MEISKLAVLIASSIFVCQVQGYEYQYDYSSEPYNRELVCAGQSVRLECTVLGTTIQNLYAWFGFDALTVKERQCDGTPPTRYCYQTENASMVVTGICEGETSCIVTAYDEFQDPCGSGFVKYLEVQYNCNEKIDDTAIPMLSLTTTHEQERIYKQKTSVPPTSEILGDGSILTSSSGDVTEEWRESTQKLTGTCQGCLVWKIWAPVIAVVFLILVCVIVFIARRNHMKGKEKKEDKQEQQL